MNECPNCRPDKIGSLIKVDGGRCILCKRPIHPPFKSFSESRWDRYFHKICVSVASKSSCMSRQIGGILVKDKSIVSTGYNGAPRGVPHCGEERLLSDPILCEALSEEEPPKVNTTCPRKILGYKSGEGMQWCPAQHAEENCVSNAARLGVSVLGSTLYMNSVIPCQKCYGTLINAGIAEIVVDVDKLYDPHTQFIINTSDIEIRSFEL